MRGWSLHDGNLLHAQYSSLFSYNLLTGYEPRRSYRAFFFPLNESLILALLNASRPPYRKALEPGTPPVLLTLLPTVINVIHHSRSRRCSCAQFFSIPDLGACTVFDPCCVDACLVFASLSGGSILMNLIFLCLPVLS